MNKGNSAVALSSAWIAGLVILIASGTAWAHDPIFGIGPHALRVGFRH